jgi:small subunit ribosomal protein S2
MLEKDPTLRELLEAGVHFGHRSARWNPKMQKFIFAEKGGIHIINLEKTVELLKEADNFLAKQVAEGKTVLFVGTKKQAVEIVRKAADSCGMPYVIERWPGGLLTNFSVVKQSIDMMVKMRQTVGTEEFEKMNKKEQSSFKTLLARKETLFGGLASLKKMPDIVFLIDVPSQKIAVKETQVLNVPTVALVDTNANPDLIQWPIPANDDATKALELLVNHIAQVISINKPKTQS